MEYLDYYDENGQYLGKETREKVHQKGLWHKTVHCWLYDQEGNVYFQIRKDSNTFYTTASGHVLAGETINETFAREIKEEIGLDINADSAQLVSVKTWIMDTEKNNTIIKDRAFANVYICEFKGESKDFNFGIAEVKGIAKMKAKDALNLFYKEKESIPAIIINENNCEIKENIKISQFLVMQGENPLEKYGLILNEIIEITKMRPGVGVGVFILKNNKVLLGLRNPDKHKASSELKGEGTWTMPGGKVEWMETLIGAAKRELKEETDLEAVDIKFLGIQDDFTITAHYVTVCFIVNKYKGRIKAMEPETILEWKWFSISDLPSNMYLPSKKCIEKYLKNVIYK